MKRSKLVFVGFLLVLLTLLHLRQAEAVPCPAGAVQADCDYAEGVWQNLKQYPPQATGTARQQRLVLLQSLKDLIPPPITNVYNALLDPTRRVKISTLFYVLSWNGLAEFLAAPVADDQIICNFGYSSVVLCRTSQVGFLIDQAQGIQPAPELGAPDLIGLETSYFDQIAADSRVSLALNTHFHSDHLFPYTIMAFAVDHSKYFLTTEETASQVPAPYDTLVVTPSYSGIQTFANGAIELTTYLEAQDDGDSTLSFVPGGFDARNNFYVLRVTLPDGQKMTFAHRGDGNMELTGATQTASQWLAANPLGPVDVFFNLGGAPESNTITSANPNAKYVVRHTMSFEHVTQNGFTQWLDANSNPNSASPYVPVVGENLVFAKSGAISSVPTPSTTPSPTPTSTLGPSPSPQSSPSASETPSPTQTAVPSPQSAPSSPAASPSPETPTPQVPKMAVSATSSRQSASSQLLKFKVTFSNLVNNPQGTSCGLKVLTGNSARVVTKLSKQQAVSKFTAANTLKVTAKRSAKAATYHYYQVVLTCSLNSRSATRKSSTLKFKF